MSTYTRKAVSGAGISFVMGLLAMAVAYATRVVLARYLGPTDYGLFYAVLTFVLFFLFFRDLGLGHSLVKYIAEFKVDNRYNEIKTAILSVLLFQLCSSFILIVFFIGFAETVAEQYFQSEKAPLMLYILVVYIIFSVFFILLKSIFRGFQKMFLFSSVEFVKNLLVLLFVFFFFKLGYGLLSPVLAFSVASILLFLLYLFLALRLSQFRKSRIVDFSHISKKVILFGIPLFAVSFAEKIISSIDTLVLTYFRPLEEVGIYNVVLPSSLILLYFGTSVATTAFPLVSELWKKNDVRRLTEGLRLLHKYSFLAVVPVIFTIFSFSEFFITLFFGAEYNSGARALQILVVGILFFIVATINTHFISAIGKPKVVAKMILVAAVLNIIFDLLLVPFLGMDGAAIATAMSYTYVFISSTIVLSKILATKYPFALWMKQLIAAVLFIVVVSGIKELLSLSIWLELVASVLAAIVIYIIVAGLFGLIDMKEMKHYLSLMRK